MTDSELPLIASELHRENVQVTRRFSRTSDAPGVRPLVIHRVESASVACVNAPSVFPCCDSFVSSPSHQKDKCFQYWPEKGCWMYGNIRVAMEDCIVLVDYTIRKFCVQYVSKIIQNS